MHPHSSDQAPETPDDAGRVPSSADASEDRPTGPIGRGLFGRRRRGDDTAPAVEDELTDDPVEPAAAPEGDAPAPAEEGRRGIFGRLRRTGEDPAPEAAPADEPAGDPAAGGGSGDAATVAEPDDDQPTGIVELPPAGPPLNPGRMRRERARLMEQRQDHVYHLGGLAFELFRRELLHEDVMVRRAEEIADIDRAVTAIDAQLATLDENREARRAERRRERHEAREARARAKAPAGHCVSCGEPYTATANFCGNCGSPIVRPAEPDPDPAPGAPAGGAEGGGTAAPAGDTPTQIVGDAQHTRVITSGDGQ